MANNDILTQMLEAATRGGGLRGGAGPQSGQGGLGDLLGQVLGGGQGGAGSGAMPGGADGQAGGGLGDILGQVLGGAGAPGGAAGGQAGGGGLGDILGQVLGGGGAPRGGGANPGMGDGGLGDILGQILGGAGGGSSGGAGRSGGGSVMPEASDALRKLGTGQAAAPPPQPMPTPSAPPSMPTANEMPSAKAPPQGQGGGMNDLVKYGGLAVLGVLAYKALRNWQSESGQASASAAPSGKGFVPSEMPGGPEAFSGVLVRSMIAAAQADGVVDKDEQQRIVGQLNQLGVNDADRQQIANQLRTRIDPNELVQAAKTPEMGLEIYAASVLAMTPDSPAERNYLDGLAARLGIQPGLKAQVEQMLGRA